MVLRNAPFQTTSGKEIMAKNKPKHISDIDWQHTPPAVRQVITQTLKRLEQLETRLRPSTPQSTRLLTPAEIEATGADLSGRILVVDDTEMNRDMVGRRLRRQGHAVEMAENGQQALNMLKSRPFDLVVLDIMMPIMGGYEVLEIMKADEAIPYTPVIVVTAVDELSSLVRCIELGAEDYLTKPFNPVMLKARVSASLEKKRLRDQREAYTRQLGLENQRKSNELEQARRIQLAMLPAQPPQIPYLDIAAHQQTASEVGGDYYDFFPQPDGTLVVAIGDATGHGVGSGLMVAMTKAALLATNQTDLAALLAKIHAILNKIDLGLRLNMALMILKITPMQNGGIFVETAAGGMPPIYVRRRDDTLEEILVSGLPLGVVANAQYEPTRFTLKPGDALILMSDGLSEVFNAAGQYLGLDRLRNAVAEIGGNLLEASTLLRYIEQIGADWAKGHPLYDDITLVVIRVK